MAGVSDRDLLGQRLGMAARLFDDGVPPRVVLDYLDHCLERVMGEPSSGLLWQDGDPFCCLGEESAALYTKVRAAAFPEGV